MSCSDLKRGAIWLAIMAAMASRPGFAAEPQGPCPSIDPQPFSSLPMQPGGDAASPLNITADRVEVRENLSIFSGAVEVQYGTERIIADKVTYDRLKDEIQASGNVRIENVQGDAIETGFFTMGRTTQVGETDHVTFRFPSNGARGDARRIVFRGRDLINLEEARYTRCPVGQDHWFVISRDIELDYTREVGTAENAYIKFMSVPIFYWPYLTFPLSDQRKSGFLAPRFGSSDTTGFFISAPYYVNIAPDLDATITPRFLARRGLQWQSEVRYLDADYDGFVDAEYLYKDDVTGKDRWLGTWQHNYFFNPLWAANIDVNRVSDRNYLNDFVLASAEGAAQTHIPQRLEVRYADATWRGLGRYFAYQTIGQLPELETAAVPYSRAPEILFVGNAPNRPNRPHYQLEGEVINFEHETRLSGQRVAALPWVSLPLRNSYSYLIPKAGVRHVTYSLEGESDTLSSTVPLFSLDTGLQFERPFRFADRAHTQTLEPRLFYVYVPYRYQDDLPNFDTGPQDFNFSNLFRENRYFGGDRVGDVNRITAAVSSRFLDASGGEWLRASLGQLFYLDDQELLLPEERANLAPDAEQRRRSYIVAQTRARLAPAWYLRNDLQWDDATTKTKKSSVYVQYRPSGDKIVNVGHRRVDAEQDGVIGPPLEQLELSSQWRVATRWSVLAQGAYSLTDNENIESYFGLEYNACCWIGRLYGQRRVDQVRGQTNAVYFEFELSGLISLGQSPISPLGKGSFIFE